MIRVSVSLLSILVLASCDRQLDSRHKSLAAKVPAIAESEKLPGGATSVSYRPFASFIKPAANLPQNQRAEFHAGKALARQPWIKAPTVTHARDGLGPLYNARTCLGCHTNGGKGQMPETADERLFAALVRVSLPGADGVHGVVAEPVYGEQLQSQSVALFHQLGDRVPIDDRSRIVEAPPEAYIYVDWQRRDFVYPDGSSVELRYPKLRIENLGYGALHAKTLVSLRIAPAIHGLGLLELIEQGSIDLRADAEDANSDGISGRVNQVWDLERQKTVPGRFGWKANRSSLNTVTAAAFAGDIGISNPLFPDQPCSQAQIKCQQTANGNDEENVELPAHLLDLTVEFIRNIGVPKQRSNKSNTGSGEFAASRALFYQTGCADCHTPSHNTAHSAAHPHLSQQVIWPYTDLLLHDMGPDLADGRPDYLATGSEWRTPPLWGTGLNKSVNGNVFFLHDGRAQSVEQAILWHGGEAKASQQRFVILNKEQRQALLRFVEAI